MKYLAVVDADRIHEYVFSPHELKMIRGGSQLQRKLNRELAPQRLNHQATLISANGGTVLAEFPDEASARAYCREVGELYRSETGCGSAQGEFRGGAAGSAQQAGA